MHYFKAHEVIQDQRHACQCHWQETLKRSRQEDITGHLESQWFEILKNESYRDHESCLYSMCHQTPAPVSSNPIFCSFSNYTGLIPSQR